MKFVFPIAFTVTLPLPSSAALTLVQSLDDFTSGPAPLVVSSGTQQQNHQAPTGTIPGDWRHLEVTVTSNPLNQDATVGVSTGPGEFFASLATFVEADISLTYDSNAAGLSGFDLTVGGATSLAFQVANSDENFEVSVTLQDTNNEVATLTVLQPTALSNGALLNLPFEDFNNALATDFTQIDSIQFDFQNGVSGDFVFEVLGTYTTIPEPGVTLLLLAATSSLLHRGRRA